MKLTPEEAREAVRCYQREFQESFPGEDALRAASQYCDSMLQSKMQELLKRCFAFRDPLELIAILGYIDDQKKLHQEGEPRPGRPRKPREGSSTPPADIRLESGVAPPE